MSYAVAGIDVGGTLTKGVVMSAHGEILVENTRPTPRDHHDRTLGPAVGSQVAALAEGLGLPIRRVGVAVPGLVDEDRGMGVWSANLGWRELDLVAALRPHLPAPVTIGHDVRSGLLGEHRLGAARDCEHVCFLPLGTGIATALLSDGRLVRGGAWTGEIGHLIVDPDGVACRCGRRGCLETLFGGGALERRWRAATGRDGDASEVALRAADGHPIASRIWTEGVDALVGVLAPVVAAAGSELVLVGGGLARAGDLLLEPLADGLRRRLGAAPVQVAPALLGDRAGALGAAVLAAEAVSDR